METRIHFTIKKYILSYQYKYTTYSENNNLIAGLLGNWH